MKNNLLQVQKIISSCQLWSFDGRVLLLERRVAKKFYNKFPSFLVLGKLGSFTSHNLYGAIFVVL